MTNHKENLDGIFLPITTPFLKDESIDWDGLKSNMDSYAKSKAKGFLALGSNGENKSLDEDEKVKILETVLQHKAPHQKVIVACFVETTRQALRFIKKVESMEIDYFNLLPPFYFRSRMTDEVLAGYFTECADGSLKPVLLYNAPKFSGVTLSPELVTKLSEHENIAGIKDSASSGIEKFIEAVPDDFVVMAGSINFLFPAVVSGAVGGVISMANYFPDLTQELYVLGKDKNMEKGEKLHLRLSDLNKKISGAYGVAGVKATMDLVGLVGGVPRKPLLGLKEDQKEKLRKDLKEAGLLQGENK
ncbi:dihydrodipicolinate synthase family protein [bacterium]|nr:dihydrodipicolinate synthase family protein [bacterium]NIN91541.1 dihydrodipicolinate synthase family protein [bacterium]NIO73016.1 dihydrodipicolinate synthase family protein [bacterium]